MSTVHNTPLANTVHTPPPTSAYVSVAAAAALLGVPRATLRGWALRGVVGSVRLGGRRLIERASLERLAPAAAR